MKYLRYGCLSISKNILFTFIMVLEVVALLVTTNVTIGSANNKSVLTRPFDDIVNKEGAAKAQTMDWATANGYLTSANTNVYSTPSFAVTRGCAAYRGKDGLDETGTWRVPTRGECALILLFYKKMEETQETTGFQPFALSPKDLTYYWSATEKGGDSKDAWSMRLYADDKMTGYGLNTGYSDKEKKEYYLRCIRDIP